MANILGKFNGLIAQSILAVDANPGASTGTVAGVGSIAAVNDGSGLFLKTATGNTAWSPIRLINVSTITSNTTAVSGTTYLVNSASAAITITLPTPALNAFVGVKDFGYNAAVNNITIAQHASEKIENVAASKVFQTNGGYWAFVSDGTNWAIIN